jgi:hypothetical protein
MTIAPSFPQNFMAAPIYCNTAVSPPESGPSAMTAKAIWFLLGRRNEPLASELIQAGSSQTGGLPRRLHQLDGAVSIEGCASRSATASGRAAGISGRYYPRCSQSVQAIEGNRPLFDRSCAPWPCYR